MSQQRAINVKTQEGLNSSSSVVVVLVEYYRPMGLTVKFSPVSFQNAAKVSMTIPTRQSKQCGFSIYIFDNSKSKSMVMLVWTEKMVLCGLVFARKIDRMILIQNMV